MGCQCAGGGKRIPVRLRENQKDRQLRRGELKPKKVPPLKDHWVNHEIARSQARRENST